MGQLWQGRSVFYVGFFIFLIIVFSPKHAVAGYDNFFWGATWLVGSQLPSPEISLLPAAVEVRSCNHWTAREVPITFRRATCPSPFILVWPGVPYGDRGRLRSEESQLPLVLKTLGKGSWRVPQWLWWASFIGCGVLLRTTSTKYWSQGLSQRLGEGNGNPLWYSCLENPIDRGTGGLQAMESQKSWTCLSN